MVFERSTYTAGRQHRAVWPEKARAGFAANEGLVRPAKDCFLALNVRLWWGAWVWEVRGDALGNQLVSDLGLAGALHVIESAHTATQGRHADKVVGDFLGLHGAYVSGFADGWDTSMDPLDGGLRWVPRVPVVHDEIYRRGHHDGQYAWREVRSDVRFLTGSWVHIQIWDGHGVAPWQTDVGRRPPRAAATCKPGG
jgi:hypothetical protein